MLAAIDLGSNSFRLQIGQYVRGKMRIVHTAREPNRLASGLNKNNLLSKAAIGAGVLALERLQQILSMYPVRKVRAVATNTLRVARNAKDFLKKAESALGYPIEVISGEEEGRLIYLGVDHLLKDPTLRRLIVDIGGGSTEVVLGKGAAVSRVESFNVGTVSQGTRFFPKGAITEKNFNEAILSAKSYFEDESRHYKKRHWDQAFASSGTMRSISEIIANHHIGDGTPSLKNLKALKDKMIEVGQMSKLHFDGLNPQRTLSVVGGLSIMIAIMQEFSVTQMNPVESGLRMGILWDLSLQETQYDRRDQSVRGFIKRYNANLQRAQLGADLARNLFQKMAPSSDRLSKYVYWSGLMLEVGMFVSPSSYHKHGAYLVEHADLAGFTAREQEQMGQLILAQQGNLKKVIALLDDLDMAKAILAIRLAVMLRHSHAQVDLKKIAFRFGEKFEIIMPKSYSEDYQTLFYWLGREVNWWNDIGVELVLRKRQK